MELTGRIVIAGGSGFLGLNLARYLGGFGCEVIVLSRHRPAEDPRWRHVAWDARTLGDWEGISRIHEQDRNRLFARAITEEGMTGAYLATAPKPVSNAEFMREPRLANLMHHTGNHEPSRLSIARSMIFDMPQGLLKDQDFFELEGCTAVTISWNKPCRILQ